MRVVDAPSEFGYGAFEGLVSRRLPRWTVGMYVHNHGSLAFVCYDVGCLKRLVRFVVRMDLVSRRF